MIYPMITISRKLEDQPPPSIALDMEDAESEVKLSSRALSAILADGSLDPQLGAGIELDTVGVDVQMVGEEKGGSFELGDWV